MNKTKRGYEAPTTELLVVRFEQNIMSLNYGASKEAGGVMGTNDYGDDPEDLF